MYWVFGNTRMPQSFQKVLGNVKTRRATGLHFSFQLILNLCLCNGMCVTELPNHVICARPHQNASEHVESVKNCKSLRDNDFTFVNGSGSKEVLMY